MYLYPSLHVSTYKSHADPSVYLFYTLYRRSLHHTLSPPLHHLNLPLIKRLHAIPHLQHPHISHLHLHCVWIIPHLQSHRGVGISKRHHHAVPKSIRAETDTRLWEWSGVVHVECGVWWWCRRRYDPAFGVVIEPVFKSTGGGSWHPWEILCVKVEHCASSLLAVLFVQA
jgi:hypothetical protein